LGPCPSRAVTKAKASALVDITYIKELLLNMYIQRRKILQEKENYVTKLTICCGEKLTHHVKVSSGTFV
jgi:hypothetical protein